MLNGSNPYDRGGGMDNYSSSPTVTNCTFSGNSAYYDGGGMDNYSSSPTVTNCTFSGNSAQFGGGMCNRSSSPTVINCTFSDNSTFGSATSKGGGMYNEGNSNPSVTNCTFSGNSARWGGGMANWTSSPTLTNCTFSGNSSYDWGGGGMWNRSSSSPMLTNCTFGGNSARYGGGISNEAGSSPTVTNCTFSGNSASESGGGMDNYENSRPTLTNSILWGNTASSGSQIYNGSATVSYSDVQGGWPGTGNIDENPLFVDSAIGDYHLKSQAGRWDSNSQSWVKDDVTSPCIDRGSPASDWTAELWPHGGRINLGAYGGTPEASMSLSTVGNVADLNIDNAVNGKDFANFADTWQTEQVLLPQDLDRNRTVDFSDLRVFADNWLKEFQEVEPVGLVAYWKLDETEGIFAHDSVGDNDGVLMIENPLWRPLGGQVDGALEFDGVDDFVFTSFVLDPDDGPLSVFAWIKGGAPGQVIMSQTGAANWLLADPADGELMTELKSSGRFGGPLYSQTVITDGDWHRVGLTWDGSTRILFVDDVEVAKDTQSGLAPSDRGLNIGAGKNPSAGSFFSGLIDDIRIYNRAVRP